MLMASRCTGENIVHHANTRMLKANIKSFTLKQRLLDYTIIYAEYVFWYYLSLKLISVLISAVMLMHKSKKPLFQFLELSIVPQFRV